ncbi:MAG TPA: type IV toxin-antitoxin system AbiEi family antitoxin domain-containing protein [Spirochaetales bacterium]|jgi:hypothetical protein|nr:type IV toxin-antitoxin system AbiEi family antitoxin domain-containing protein [Spirochaetales bacterium]
MSTPDGTNIKKLLKKHPRNTVITARELLVYGVSRDLQRVYVRSGWLKRIGPGAYIFLDDTVSLDGAVHALQTGLGLSVHLGGYSALGECYGKTHNLPAERASELFAFRGEKLPAWFRSNYASNCVVSVSSFLPAKAGLVDYDSGGFTVQISSLERAMLEMLYLSPERHTLRETYQIMELLTSVKPSLMQSLLEQCSSVKVKRLFLYMSDRAGHAWINRLDLSRIALGSGVREIEKGGKVDKKYNIVINDLGEI